MKAGCERRRVLRLGSIVPVDLDVVEGCISSRRVMVLVVRVCVIGRVQESSSSFGVVHDCAGVQENVDRALDRSMDGFISVMGNVSAFEEVMLVVAVWVDEPGVVVEDITVLSTRGMFVFVIETSGMEVGSGLFTVDECVDGEKLRSEVGDGSGTACDCVCVVG